MADYVLMKQGLYYRPDSRGYTGALAEAGRYSQEQAQALVEHCGGEVTMLPAHDAYPFSPACWPETKIKTLEAEVSRLESDLHAVGHAKTRLADALTVFAKMNAMDAPDGVSLPDWLYAVTSARAALKTYASAEGGWRCRVASR